MKQTLFVSKNCQYIVEYVYGAFLDFLRFWRAVNLSRRYPMIQQETDVGVVFPFTHQEVVMRVTS